MAYTLHHWVWLTAGTDPASQFSPTNRFPGNLNQMGLQREVKANLSWPHLEKNFCKHTKFIYFSNWESFIFVVAARKIHFCIFLKFLRLRYISQWTNLWKKRNTTNREFIMNLGRYQLSIQYSIYIDYKPPVFLWLADKNKLLLTK